MAGAAYRRPVELVCGPSHLVVARNCVPLRHAAPAGGGCGCGGGGVRVCVREGRSGGTGGLLAAPAAPAPCRTRAGPASGSGRAARVVPCRGTHGRGLARTHKGPPGTPLSRRDRRSPDSAAGVCLARLRSWPCGARACLACRRKTFGRGRLRIAHRRTATARETEPAPQPTTGRAPPRRVQYAARKKSRAGTRRVFVGVGRKCGAAQFAWGGGRTAVGFDRATSSHQQPSQPWRTQPDAGTRQEQTSSEAPSPWPFRPEGDTPFSV